MNIELTESELESIVNRITHKFLLNAVKDGIQESAKEYAKKYLKVFDINQNIKFELVTLIKPVIHSILNENKLFENELRKALDEQFNTEKFKEVTIEMLQNKIMQLQNEIEKLRLI